MPKGIYPRQSTKKRFWVKVNKTETCWLWTGAITKGGYGEFQSQKKIVYAHRLAYEFAYGLIPEGMEIDHLCRVRCCVNPLHLEPVTHKVNVLRGEGIAAKNAHATHCPQGHPYDLLNTYLTKGRWRQCRKCRG